MILVRGFIPPGAQKGDTFDVEVRVPHRTGTTSLEGGWLMQSRLRETQVVDAVLHSGHVMAAAQGPILVDALFGVADDEVLLRSGRVLSGGVVSTPRPVGADHSRGAQFRAHQQPGGVGDQRPFSLLRSGREIGRREPQAGRHGGTGGSRALQRKPPSLSAGRVEHRGGGEGGRAAAATADSRASAAGTDQLAKGRDSIGGDGRGGDFDAEEGAGRRTTRKSDSTRPSRSPTWTTTRRRTNCIGRLATRGPFAGGLWLLCP